MTLRQQAVCDLTCFRSEQIPYVWDKVEPLIQKALDRGSNYCLEDILEGLCNGSMQLWTYGEMQCALVTTIQKKGDTKYLLFLAMGGKDLHVWIKYLPLVEEWAKQHGCTEARIYGRAGWARHTGYTIEYTKMVKEI